MPDLRLSAPRGFNRRAGRAGPEKGLLGSAGSGAPWVGRGRAGSVGGGMMPPGLTALLAVVIAMVGVGVAAAQGPAGAAERLDPVAALETHKQVSQWLEAWETPTEAPLPEGCFGVWVGIRFAGRPMGAASVVDASRLTGAGTSPDGAVADVPTLRVLPAAVRRAMGAALESAGGQEDPDVRADRQQSFLESPFRTLELDLAHSPVRIRGTSLDRVMLSVRPGIDGLLLRRQGESFVIFPAEMLAFDMRPASAIVSLLAQSGVAMESLDTEIANSTIRVWKFQTLHLAQATRFAAPTFLDRGSRPIPLDAIDEAEIGRLAEEAAAYLMRSTLAFPDESGRLMLLGDYAPHTDRRLQERATFAEHALASLALFEYSRTAAAGAVNAGRARAAAVGLLTMLAGEEATRQAVAAEARAAALVCLAARRLNESERTADLDLLIEEAHRTALRACVGPAGFDPELSPEDRALVAAAVATRQVVDAAWLSIGLDLQPLGMPWIVFAEVEAAQSPQPIPTLPALAALRTRIWSRQEGRDAVERGVEADLVGAIAYRPTQPPDWQTAHLAAGLALMLGDPRCTSAEARVGEILHLQRTFRYLRQLQVRDVDRYRLRNPDLALGGIRAALWDQTMPTAASAMTLLAAAEMLRSLDRLREAADKPQPPPAN